MTNELNEQEARGMTVNERLFHIGLIDEFYEAAEQRDETKMRTILEKLYLGSGNVEAIIINHLNKP
jgi:hypothetical protein